MSALHLVLTLLPLVAGGNVVAGVFETFRKPSVAVFVGCDNLETARTLTTRGYYVKFCWDVRRMYDENNIVFIADLRCKNITDVLNKAEEEKLYAFPYRWIVLGSEYDINDTITIFLNSLSIMIDSHFIVVQRVETRYHIHRVFKIQKTGTYIRQAIGKWDAKHGLTSFQVEAVKSLNRTTLRTAIVVTHNDTLNHLTDYREKHTDSITKVNYVLVNHLADTVNASLTFTIKSTWGYKNQSGWTGMMGELTEDRADIGADRIHVVDYVAMTTPTRSYFIFRQPKLSYVTNVFLLPFHWTVWLSTFGLFVVAALGLKLILWWEKIQKDEETDAFLLPFGAICQQGAAAVPNGTPGRIITLLVFISLMFLYTSYSANIVALLQSSSTSIESLDDLLHSRLRVGVDDTVFNRFYFPAATEPTRRALYLKKVEPNGQKPNYFSMEDGIKKLRKGLFAFHMESGPGYEIIGETFYEDEKCDLNEISFLQVPDPWLALQKNSTYKEILKTGLRRIQETGLQSREFHKIYTKKPQCQGMGSSFVSVGIIDCYPAAVVFLVGIGIALFIFILELTSTRLWSINNH